MNIDMYAFTPRKLTRVVQHALGQQVTLEDVEEIRDRWRASWTEAAFYFDLIELEAKERARKTKDKIVAGVVTAALIGIFLACAMLLGHATWSNG